MGLLLKVEHRKLEFEKRNLVHPSAASLFLAALACLSLSGAPAGAARPLERIAPLPHLGQFPPRRHETGVEKMAATGHSIDVLAEKWRDGVVPVKTDREWSPHVAYWNGGKRFNVAPRQSATAARPLVRYQVTIRRHSVRLRLTTRF